MSTELDDKVAFPADELVLVQGSTTSEIPSAFLSLASRERGERPSHAVWTRLLQRKGGRWPDPVCMLLRDHERHLPCAMM